MAQLKSGTTVGGNTVLTTASTVSNLADGSSVLKNLAEDSTPELGGELDAGLHSIGFSEKDNGSSGTAKTIDWKTSNKQKITMTGSCTFTFLAPSNPSNLLLRIIQDSVGGRNLTFLSSIKWAGGTEPTFTSDANAIDILSLYYDGTNYYGMAALNFS